MALTALVLGGVELTSCVLFRLFRDRFTFFEPQRYRVSTAQLPKLRRIHHSELGWQRRTAAAFGARVDPTVYEHARIATFGDSFTYGDEVNDQDTWQVRLAAALGARVYNFGANGYGPDQAYLRFQRDFPKVRTPLVTMGMIPESINRIVNVYRPFYYPRTGIPLTKPRFRLEGALVLMPNPVRSAAELHRLTDAEFLERIGADDWWYNRDRHPVLRFPYSRILLNKRLWLEAVYGLGSTRIDEVSPRPWDDLWENDEARALLLAILDAFVREAAALGATPVFMMFPLRHDLEQRLAGARPNGLVRWQAFCQARGYWCFDGISALAERVGATQVGDLYLQDHLSPAGNTHIARAFHDFLARNDLLAEANDPVRHEGGY